MDDIKASQRDGGLKASTPFRSGRTRARILIYLFYGFIITALVAIYSDYLQLLFLAEAAEWHVSAEAAEANDARQTAVGALRIIVFLACAVAFLFWIHRAYSNLTALGNLKAGLAYSPTWAVVGFFIPLINLFLPYRVVKEIWDKSDPSILTEDDLAFTPPDSSPLILLWWVIWVASSVLGNLAGRFAGESETPDTFAWTTKVDMLSLVLSVFAAALAVLVVNSIDKRQAARSEHVVHVSPAPPPPLYTATSPPATP